MIDFEAHFGELRTHADALLARVKAIAENRLAAIRAEEEEIEDMLKRAVAKAAEIKNFAVQAVDHAAGLGPEPSEPASASTHDAEISSRETDAADSASTHDAEISSRETDAADSASTEAAAPTPTESSQTLFGGD